MFPFNLPLWLGRITNVLAALHSWNDATLRIFKTHNEAHIVFTEEKICRNVHSLAGAWFIFSSSELKDRFSGKIKQSDLHAYAQENWHNAFVFANESDNVLCAVLLNDSTKLPFMCSCLGSIIVLWFSSCT